MGLNVKLLCSLSNSFWAQPNVHYVTRDLASMANNVLFIECPNTVNVLHLIKINHLYICDGLILNIYSMHSPLENTNFILVQRNWYSTKYKGYIFPFHLPPRKADLWFFPQTFYLVYSCMCACLWRHKIIWQITFWCKINRNSPQQTQS